MLVAGALGGMVWAAIAALLRDRFNANEILVSLMLVYVAELLLELSGYGPWKDPAGYNFPQTITFRRSTLIPRCSTGTARQHRRVLIALAAVASSGCSLFRTYAGFQLQVGGLAPARRALRRLLARARALWTALLIVGRHGRARGRARGRRAARPAHAHVPAGYGFAAIIVAFVGRLHPVGIAARRPADELLYIGGELAQIDARPASRSTGVFQGTAAVHAARAATCSSATACASRRACGRAGDECHGPARAGHRRGCAHDRHGRRILVATLDRRHAARSRRSACSINERAGVVNLGAEGMMLVRRDRRLRGRRRTPADDWLGFGAGHAAGAVLAALFGVLADLAQDQPVRDRPGASLFGAASRPSSAQLHRRQARRARALCASRCAGRPAARGPGAVPPVSPAGLSLARAARRDLRGSSTARAPGWCCARSASRPSRRMRSATRCVRIRFSRRCSAARCAASPAPTSRSSTRRCGSRA